MAGQGLPIKGPIHRSSSAPAGPAVYTQALTVAGAVPTAGEITTALQAAYAGGKVPVQGDTVHLTVGGVLKLRSTVSSQGAASGLWVVSFVVDGVTYYGFQVQTGWW